VSISLVAFFLAGTIVHCPACGEGLYKVISQASTKELVLNDRFLLAPVNHHSIPTDDVGIPLACRLCGGQVFQDRQIHAFQEEWE
jgi:hypothetical protein